MSVLSLGTREERVSLILKGLVNGYCDLEGFPAWFEFNGERVFILTEDLQFMIDEGLLVMVRGEGERVQ